MIHKLKVTLLNYL